MATDFIPASDESFSIWVQTFAGALPAYATALGLPPADMTALTAQAADWQTVLQELVAAQHGARMCRQAKDDARNGLEELIRNLVRRIQPLPGLTDVMRQSLGITVAGSTAVSMADAADAPMLKVDTSERFKHTIAFFQTTPDGKGTRAKPKGVKGCAIFRKIGAPPTVVNGMPTDMEFLALDTSSPYILAYGTAEAGKTVYYMAQWMAGPHGDEPGPWSETVEATVVG